MVQLCRFRWLQRRLSEMEPASVNEYVEPVPALTHAAQCFDIHGGASRGEKRSRSIRRSSSELSKLLTLFRKAGLGDQFRGTMETFVLDGEDSLSQTSRFPPRTLRQSAVKKNVELPKISSVWRPTTKWRHFKQEGRGARRPNLAAPTVAD